MSAREPSAGWSVEIVDSEGRLEELRQFWAEKENIVDAHSFLPDFSWYQSWYGHRNVADSVYLALVRKGQHLRAVAPLVGTRRGRNYFGYSYLRFAGYDLFDWHDVLWQEYDEEGYFTLIDFLRRKIRGYVHFENIPDASLTNSSLERYNQTARCEVRRETRCYYIDMRHRCYDEYYRNDTSKKFVRIDMKRLYNKLAEREWYLRSTNLSCIEADIETVQQLHRGSQMHMGRKSMYDDPRINAIMQSILRLECERGSCRIYFLYVDECPVAYMIGFVRGKSFFWWNTGYDVEHRLLSPSKVLLNEIIKQCFLDGMDIFSFMKGYSEYKEKWTQTYTMNSHYTYWGSDLKTTIIRGLRKLS